MYIDMIVMIYPEGQWTTLHTKTTMLILNFQGAKLKIAQELFIITKYILQCALTPPCLLLYTYT